MGLGMRARLKTGSNMDTGSLLGWITVFMTVILRRIILMGMGRISGQIGGSIVASGKIVKCMGLGSLLGQMEGRMRADISWTRRTDLVCLFGRIRGGMKEIGSTGSRKGKASYTPLTKKVVGAFGAMESESNGNTDTK